MPLIRLLLADPFIFLVPLALLVGTVLAGLLLRLILFRLISRWSASSDSNLGTLVIATLRGPIVLWSLILGLQSFESDALSMTDPHFLEDVHGHDHDHDHVCDAHCGHGDGTVPPLVAAPSHTHDPSVASVSFTFDRPFDAQRLLCSLQELLAIRGDDIFRVKGILHAQGDDRRHVLQGVHRILELKPALPWWDETPASKLVFIGRHLQDEKLRARLEACLAVPQSESHEALEAA